MIRTIARSFIILADVVSIPRNELFSMVVSSPANIVACFLIVVGIAAIAAALIILKKKKK